MKFSSVLKNIPSELSTLVPESQYYRAMLALVTLIFSSTFGLMWVEGYTFLEGLYMTIITISTVGYGEVNELSQHGRTLMMCVIMVSMVTLAYTVSLISKSLVDSLFQADIQRKKNRKKIRKMTGHTIVIGCGRTGREAVQRLVSYDRQVVVVEKDEDALHDFNKSMPHIITIKGDATDESILMEANIDHASSMLCTLPSDANNLFTVLTAKELNPRLSIITRSSSERSNKKLRFAGADRIIMPDKLGGDLMASLSVMPSVVEFINQLQMDYSKSANLRELTMKELPKEMVGKTLGQLNIRRETGCNIIGIKAANGDYIVNPGIDEVLYSGVKIIVLGNPQQIEMLTKQYNLDE